MYYVYVLYSRTNGDLYIGSTADVATRFNRHDAGAVRSTKPYRPWRLLEVREYDTRSEAVRAERFLKSHQQRGLVHNRHKL